ADTTKNAFEKLFNAWYSGDIAELEKLTEGGILEKPEIREKILVARNMDWDAQLHVRLQQPGTLLVAVGAAHLVGPDAVQSMLEKRGYRVEKIQ
ncbi:MAG: TraB/GumN family protein, partial [Pseudomonadota bacterium]